MEKVFRVVLCILLLFIYNNYAFLLQCEIGHIENFQPIIANKLVFDCYMLDKTSKKSDRTKSDVFNPGAIYFSLSDYASRSQKLLDIDACRRWRNTSSVGDMLDDLEWPSLETRREQSSLTFFYKIHSGTVDLDKDKYLTPAPNLRRTRASHESQYTRYFAYSDALKNSFFPRTIPMWNSLPSSVVSSKTIEEFKAQI